MEGVRGPSRPAPYTRLLHLHPKMAPVERPKERPRPAALRWGWAWWEQGAEAPEQLWGGTCRPGAPPPPCPLWPHWLPGLDWPRQLLFDSSAIAKSWPRQAGQEVT